MGMSRTIAAACVLCSVACSDPDQPEPCDTVELTCEGNSLRSCEDGQWVETPCREGAECRDGQCIQTDVVLPLDAGPHELRSEWWYYTGHLTDGQNDWGFQVTIFQYRLTTITMYMCHVAVIDNIAGVHYHLDGMSGEAITWSSSPAELEVLHCSIALDGAGNDHIVGEIADGEEKDGHEGAFVVDLSLSPEKEVVLHGGDGVIPMGTAGSESFYYSYTRMAAQGTLTTSSGTHSVTGQAWMDHQWGDFDVAEFQGWDWWSIQLEDQSEIMLFQFRDWEGQLVSQAGSITDPEGNTTELEGFDAFSVASLRSWQSTHTDGEYPLDWDVTIGSGSYVLEVRTHIDDQEMYNLAQNYWEGPVGVTGTRGGEPVSGVGFVELTGYATDNLDP